MSQYQKRKSHTREKAIDWQSKFAEMSMSYGELADWQAYFKRLGRRYGLLREFAENGIV